jgi:thiamine pyrophosphate-dependent acetolactate synthase large subunit-like protein
MNGGEAVVRALAAAGVDLVFGIPGTHTLPLHRHLAAAGIRHVTPRHEQGGGYAADGYARISGRAGVVLATSGPGVMNTVTAAATAYADSVPLLIVSPAMPEAVHGRDSGFLHEMKDQGAVMDAATAWSRRVRSPAEAVTAIAEAFTGFAAGRPRPVHVDLPLDVLASEEPADVHAPVTAAPPAPDASAVDGAAALLEIACAPAIVAGGGARGAAWELTALAEQLGAPVLTTVNGKGVVDERHPLSFGASIRLRAAQDWLSGRDVVLAVGTELGESDLWRAPPPLRNVIRVDIDPAQLQKNVPAVVGVRGDARAAAARLVAALGRAGAGAPPADLAGVRAAIRDEALRDGAPFADLCAALDATLGPDGILAGDSTMAAYYGAVHLLPMDARRRFIYPTGYATLGYALPAAIGAKLAAPERPVIALVGDGGLLFTVAELVTAAELGLALPVVVPNNGGYGEIRDEMDAAGIGRVGVDLQVPDLPRLGEALGGAGVRAGDAAALGRELRAALERPGPTLIEVPAAR